MRKTEREEWILDYLRTNPGADVTNAEFHDAYAAAFPRYKRIFKMWGAMPVPQAMRDLEHLARDGRILRHRLPLCAGEGFPKWVWIYYIPKNKNAAR